MDHADMEVIRDAYRRFNDRDIDAALALMAPDVVWPNSIDGGFVSGHDGVRAHWRQVFAMSEPSIEPRQIIRDGDGTVVAHVRQVVTDKQGQLLSDDRVVHRFETRGGRIRSMHIDRTPT